MAILLPAALLVALLITADAIPWVIRLARRTKFLDLPGPLCKSAGADTGDAVVLILRAASERLPEELELLLAKDPVAKRHWKQLTPSQQRMLREHIAAAKQTATRRRRALQALNP